MRNESRRRTVADQRGIRHLQAVPLRSFLDEAADCRAQAKLFAGRPEEGLLVDLAREFEKLASATNFDPQDRIPDLSAPCA